MPETEKLPKQKVPKTPCPLGFKPKRPTHDAFNKNTSTGSDDIWSYNFNITNLKILNEKEFGKVSTKNIIDVIKKPFELLNKI
jgi:hypothetical protein